MSWILGLRRRSFARVILLLGIGIIIRSCFLSGRSSAPQPSSYSARWAEIREHNVIERVTRSEKTFNVRKHRFLQVRMGRDERDDILSYVIRNGVHDFWQRFQKP
jgi:hypothetical protein